MKTGGLVVVGLGAVGLAALAAVMLKKPAAAAGQPAAPGAPATPGLPARPPGVAPATPTPAPAGALVFVDDVTSVHLRQGQYYRGRLNVPGVALPPFSLNATEEEIAKGLSALGFVDVRVYVNVSALPSDWPASTAQNTQAGTRWFQGQWSGITADVPKPFDLVTRQPIVESVWTTASPALVSQRNTTSGGVDCGPCANGQRVMVAVPMVDAQGNPYVGHPSCAGMTG